MFEEVIVEVSLNNMRTLTIRHRKNLIIKTQPYHMPEAGLSFSDRRQGFISVKQLRVDVHAAACFCASELK